MAQKTIILRKHTYDPRGALMHGQFCDYCMEAADVPKDTHASFFFICPRCQQELMK